MNFSQIKVHTDPSILGFSMTFSNNITVSVRIGSSNYSNGKNTAECAAYHTNTYQFIRVDGFDYEDDEVLHHLSADEVAQFIHIAKSMKI